MIIVVAMSGCGPGDKPGEYCVEYSTSSARYSKRIAELLGFGGHSDCQRVESVFNIPNMIRLPTEKIAKRTAKRRGKPMGAPYGPTVPF